MGQIMKILEELQFFFMKYVPAMKTASTHYPEEKQDLMYTPSYKCNLHKTFFHVSASVLQQVAVITLLSLLQLGAVFLVLKSRLFL